MEFWLKNRIQEMGRTDFLRSASEQRSASVCSYNIVTHAVAQDRGPRRKVQTSSDLPGQAPLPGPEDQSREYAGREDQAPLAQGLGGPLHSSGRND